MSKATSLGSGFWRFPIKVVIWPHSAMETHKAEEPEGRWNGASAQREGGISRRRGPVRRIYAFEAKLVHMLNKSVH